MDISTFWAYIDRLQETNSGNKKKEIIREIVSENSEDSWTAAISFIAGEEFDNIGVANRTIENAIEQSKLPYTSEEIEELRYEHGKMTSGLLSEYPTPTSDSNKTSNKETLTAFTDTELESSSTSEPNEDKLWALYNDCKEVAQLSGNELVSKVSQMFVNYYPPVVSFALLGDLSLGASSKTITSAVAEDSYTRSEIERARSFVTSTVKFVRIIESGVDSLPTTVPVGSPFDPMLASRKDVEENPNWTAQLKLDGHRLLLHVKGGSCTAYTRDKNDVTESLPELQEINWPEGEYVFDSEAMAYDESLGNLPFSKTSQRIGRKHNIDQFDYDIRFHIFDLIVSDGTDLTEEPFKNRFAHLESVAPKESKYVSLVDLFDDVGELVEWAKQEGYEGVIAKDLNGTYEFGKRSGYWRKIKVTEETVDLRITRFEKRQDDQLDYEVLGKMGVETKDGVFVGYIGTGFSDELAKKIWENQEEYMGKVVEVQFEGFDDKLRFPSFKYFRDDGTPDTLETVKELAPEV